MIITLSVEYTHLHFAYRCIPPVLKTALLFPNLYVHVCFWRSIIPEIYAGMQYYTVDASLNEGYCYSATCTCTVVSSWLLFPQSCISRQLTLFERWLPVGKYSCTCTYIWKTNKQLQTICECFCCWWTSLSSLVAVQKAKKLADAAWKAVTHGKDEVVVSDVLSSIANAW